MSYKLEFRNPTDNELSLFLQKNNQHSPALGTLDPLGLNNLLAQCLVPPMVIDKESGDWIGLFIVLNEKANYQSLNFQFFKKMHSSFLYIDRIAVFHEFQRKGYGQTIYKELLTSFGGHEPVTLEVNLEPINQVSLDFHKSLGFVPVGEARVGSKMVQYMHLMR